MKQANKKLIGITMIGLSAWLLVIAMVVFDHTTTAMLTSNPVPTSEQTNTSDTPRTLGASTDVIQTSTSTFAHDGPHDNDESAHAASAVSSKQSNTPLVIAIAGMTVFVAAGASAVILSRRKHTTK